MRRKKKNARIYLLLLFLFLAMGVVYAALTTSFSVSGTVGVSSAKYTINYTGSNATFSSASNTIIYGSTTTNKITPSTGYYLKSLSCTNGYTTNATTGTGATSAQTVTISNNKNASNSLCTATMAKRSFTVTMSGGNATYSSNSFAVSYAGTNKVTITPSAGYYLSSISCSNGYTVTGATTGANATGAQTVTINNNSKVASSTCTVTMAARSFTVTMSGSNVTFGATSLAVAYGGSKTVTLTPSTGYYLSSISCTNGYTVTATTGTSATAAQTITIKNNSKVANSTCTATMGTTYAANTYWEFNYTGGIQSFSVPIAGTYKLEVYGAQGGTPTTGYDIGNGGKGGYSYGNVSLTANQTIYVVVGGAGGIQGSNGGYNGGGKAGAYGMGASGGGATHIGKTNGTLANTAISNLFIVAGGGGGGGSLFGDYASGTMYGGSGGGTTGGNAYIEYYGGGLGGTQTSGGLCQNGTYPSDSDDWSWYYPGSYGKGGDGPGYGAGGGGGYYGGGSGNSPNGAAGGGGGSGYIGGVTGGSMSNGQRSGNGYAKIILVSTN